jgi:hypothetical protein
MRSKRDSPDVLRGPGFSIEHQGKYTRFETHRSTEEFQAMQRRAVASKPELLRGIKLAADELAALINKYSSFDLVAQLWLANGLFNGETYVESDSHQRPYVIEYAALVELKSEAYRFKLPVVVDCEDLVRAQELIDGIYRDAAWLDMARRIDPTKSGPPSALETATFFGARRKMMVGPSAYWQHWKDVLEGLFAGPIIRDSVETALGLSLGAVLEISTAISEGMAAKVIERLRAVHQEKEQIIRDLELYMSTGLYRGKEDGKIVLDRLRSLRSKDRKRRLKQMLMQWAFVALVDQLSFTAASLSERTGIATATIERYLEIFETRLGTTSPGFLLPAASHALERRPIVNLGGKYFCPVPHRLLWAIKPSLEDLLRKSASWEPYQHARHDLLISETMSMFCRMLPGLVVETSLSYPIGVGLEAEVDALILFDRYIFVVEGKGGNRNRTQKDAGVQARIDELVGGPAKQALRTKAYLRGNPILLRADDTTFDIGDTSSSEIVPISISLDSLDAFTSELNEVKEIAGLSEAVWAICLTDLRVISEIVSRPREFTHYLRWRLAVALRTDVMGDRDELNWLAVYLKDGPNIPKAPAGDDFLIFRSYTDAFDAYFLYKQGDRTKVEKRPSQEIPDGVRLLLDSVESSGFTRSTEAAEFILDFPLEQRREIDQAMHRIGLPSVNKSFVPCVTIEYDDRSIVLIAGAEAPLSPKRLNTGPRKRRSCYQLTPVLLGVCVLGKLYAVMNKWPVSRHCVD